MNTVTLPNSGTENIALNSEGTYQIFNSPNVGSNTKFASYEEAYEASTKNETLTTGRLTFTVSKVTPNEYDENLVHLTIEELIFFGVTVATEKTIEKGETITVQLLQDSDSDIKNYVLVGEKA